MDALSKNEITKLRVRHTALAHIILGLRKALSTLTLTEAETTTLIAVLERSKAEHEAVKSINTKKLSTTKIRVKRKKRNPSDDPLYEQKRKMAEKIKETHKMSEFKKKRIKIVQGGAPGLGKNN